MTYTDEPTIQIEAFPDVLRALEKPEKEYTDPVLIKKSYGDAAQKDGELSFKDFKALTNGKPIPKRQSIGGDKEGKTEDKEGKAEDEEGKTEDEEGKTEDEAVPEEAAPEEKERLTYTELFN